jgi:hypothetical protein
LTDAFAGFAGTLGIAVIQCRPRDPEAKGLVERANGYLETSFLPGRTFTSPGDFNMQLQDWLPVANARQHRALGCRPEQRWDVDRDAMLALPPVPPLTGWRATTRLARDHYVRVAGNDYSVDPSVIGRRVQVVADLETVTVTCAGRVVASHRRCWARHQCITDPAHLAAAVALRTLRRLTAPDAGVTGSGVAVQVRSLADYDALFGLAASPAEPAADPTSGGRVA